MGKIWIWDGTRRVKGTDWNVMQEVVENVLTGHKHDGTDSRTIDHADLGNVLPAQHHAVHIKTLDDHPLSIIPVMDDEHIPDVETLSYTNPFAVDQIPDLPRSIITDFFNAPFWDNIPDKPSTFPPSSHSEHPSLSIGGTEVISSARILEAIASISVLLKPTTDSDYDFGTSDLRFKDIYGREIVLSKLSDQRYIWSCWDADELRLVTYDGSTWRNPVLTIDKYGTLYFGLLKDVTLYRAGVNLLKTDDDFEVESINYLNGLYQGGLRGVPTDDIRNDAVTVGKLGHDIDATGIGFNADVTDGYHGQDLISVYYDPTGGQVIFDNPTQRSTMSLSYVNLKEAMMKAIWGTFNTYFQLKSSGSGYTAYGKVYRNAVAVGTERSTNSTTYVSFTESISGWSANDYYRIYNKVAPAGGMCYTNNQRLLGSVGGIITAGY